MYAENARQLFFSNFMLYCALQQFLSFLHGSIFARNFNDRPMRQVFFQGLPSDYRQGLVVWFFADCEWNCRIRGDDHFVPSPETQFLPNKNQFSAHLENTYCYYTQSKKGYCVTRGSFIALSKTHTRHLFKFQMRITSTF